MSKGRFAGVELGGTTVRVAICEGKATNIVEEEEFPTQLPQETLNNVVAWLRKHTPFEAIGVASFGPIDLKKDSPTYGYITTTPKPNWGNVDLLGCLREFNVPLAFDTDVNAPARAELVYGNHQGSKSCAYITVGTGVGVGAVVNESTVIGLMHTEGGHCMVPKAPGDDYEGMCPYHKACIEGMVTANALAARRGISITDLPDLPDDDPLWDLAAYYLAALCVNIILLLSPEVIVISGGVMKRESLFPKIRKLFTAQLNNYIKVDKIINHVDDYIVPSHFGNAIGIISACELAKSAVSQ